MDKPKILVLCTGNSARSQMAEALFRKYGGDRYAVYSAGVEPKGINPYTVRVMEEVGLSLADHRSKDVREYLGKEHFAHVFTVCHHAEQNCPSVFLTMGTHDHWDLDDPAAQEGTDAEKLAKFRAVRNQIDERVRAWLQER
ncbi:MAG: arsenate reductase ArsC [Chloroflexota bacterium]|nr:arsenate reductase ArsC [Chloroflexota bacterium]